MEDPSFCLLLNIKKTEFFLPTCDGVKTQEGLFPREIGRPVHGVKLLGGAVSRDEEFISGLALKRAKRAVELMECLKRMQDPQSELLLLRSCMGSLNCCLGSGRVSLLMSGEPSLFLTRVFGKGLRTLLYVGVLFLGTSSGG